MCAEDHFVGRADPPGAPLVVKSLGKVDALVELAYAELKPAGHLPGSPAVGALRDRAHAGGPRMGRPPRSTATPISSDPANEFLVVHNGIITNYRALKDFLVRPARAWTSMHWP